MKLTPWFPGTVKPVRAGVYERDYGRGWRSYNYWNGEKWSSPRSVPKEAEIFKHLYSPYQNLPWRGVMK